MNDAFGEGVRDAPGLRISADLAWVGRDDRAVVLGLPGLDDPRPQVLDGSAGMVWNVLAEDGPLSAEQLVETMSEIYEVDPCVVREDVARLVASLGECGFLELVGVSSSAGEGSGTEGSETSQAYDSLCLD